MFLVTFFVLVPIYVLLKLQMPENLRKDSTIQNDQVQPEKATQLSLKAVLLDPENPKA